jgi:hypothetical protein
MNKKKWIVRIGILGLLCIVIIGVILYAQPRTIFIIEPGKINAAGLIDKIAPGNSLTVYGKASNPHFESNAIKIVFVQPKQNYNLTYDLFGAGKIENKIVPPITYTPAPKEAERWITVETKLDGKVIAVTCNKEEVLIRTSQNRLYWQPASENQAREAIQLLEKDIAYNKNYIAPKPQVWGILELNAFESKSIPFNINIPEDAIAPKHWYFIIENRNAEESGLVVTRNDCLILVNMR